MWWGDKPGRGDRRGHSQSVSQENMKPCILVSLALTRILLNARGWALTYIKQVYCHMASSSNNATPLPFIEKLTHDIVSLEWIPPNWRALSYMGWVHCHVASWSSNSMPHYWETYTWHCFIVTRHYGGSEPVPCKSFSRVWGPANKWVISGCARCYFVFLGDLGFVFKIPFVLGLCGLARMPVYGVLEALWWNQD